MRDFSEFFVMTGGAMFLVPMILMLAIALIGMDIPGIILRVGGWSMVLGLITTGMGAFMALVGDGSDRT